MAAFACLVAAKLATVGVPILLKHVVDALDFARVGSELVVPVALVVLYGLLRFATTLFTELREVVFASVTERAVRSISGRVERGRHHELLVAGSAYARLWAMQQSAPAEEEAGVSTRG